MAEKWEERVTEPNAQAPSGVRQKVAGERPPLDGLRVLWIDPDRACSAECREILVAWGATIVTVQHAATGLDTAAAARPDVVVISADGGAHSPDQLARILHFLIPDPPPVILVSKRDLRGLDAALPGVIRLLPKPFDPGTMLSVLRRVERT